MDKLGSRERGQLKSLLAGESLPTDAQNSIINILRTDLPDFFSQLTSGLEKTKSENNNEVAKYLKFNTGKTRQILKKQKLTFLTQQEQDELGSALDKPIAEEGVVYQQGQAPVDREAPVETSGGGGGIPGMPSVSAPAIHPIFRTKPPTVETTKPDIAIANKSGYVAEAPPTQFHVTDKAGNIQATYSKEPLPAAPQSKLVVPGTEREDPSKLVSARSDGSIIQPTTKNPTIHIADKSGNIIKTYNVKSPGWLKNFSSNAQIFAKKNSVKIGNGLKDMFGRTANLGGRAGLGIINHGGNFLSNLSNTRSKLASNLSGAKSKITSGGGKKAAIAFAGAFFLLLFMGVLGGMGGTIPTGEAAPLPPGSSDLATCLFTRSDQSPSAASFKSPVLLSYFQEVSVKSGVPATVLAGIARIESPGIVSQTDATLSSYGCPTSETGAKGLMQVQPPGTTGYSLDGVTSGAQYLGITINQLDFCNLRQNIYLGAGVISAKAGGAWDTSKTNDPVYIDNIAEGYYGCLKYGAPPGSKCSDTRNIYSYGGDLYAGVSQCKPTSSGTVPPPPVDGNYQKWLGDFGVNIEDGFYVPQIYQWAYEVLATLPKPEVAPAFTTLIGLSHDSPITIRPICGQPSYTDGRTIFLRKQPTFCIGTDPNTPKGPTSDPNLFKHTLIHEMGHVLYNTNRTRYNSKIIEARRQDRGFLTDYSANATSDPRKACGIGDDNGNRADEDFAESVSYFINSGIKTQDYGCGIWDEELGVNPFNLQVNGQKKYAAHYQLMTNLLK